MDKLREERRQARGERTARGRRMGTVNKGGVAAKGQTDAVAFALTVQILLCIGLIGAAIAFRQAEPESFGQVKAEYIRLVGSEQEESLAEYFERVAGFFGGFFETAENVISELLPPVDSPAQEMMTPPANSTLAPFALSSRLEMPVDGVVTSPFAFRVHPISGDIDFHNGIDIAAAGGSEVSAALPGMVYRVGECDIYGKYILIHHADNLKTFYAHCYRILAETGQVVSQGEPIALVGATGLATGYHLHFGVIVEGLYANPKHGLAGLGV